MLGYQAGQVVQFGTVQGAVMPCGWEGNCGSCVAMASRHSLPQGLRFIATSRLGSDSGRGRYPGGGIFYVGAAVPPEEHRGAEIHAVLAQPISIMAATASPRSNHDVIWKRARWLPPTGSARPHPQISVLSVCPSSRSSRLITGASRPSRTARYRRVYSAFHTSSPGIVLPLPIEYISQVAPVQWLARPTAL